MSAPPLSTKQTLGGETPATAFVRISAAHGKRQRLGGTITPDHTTTRHNINTKGRPDVEASSLLPPNQHTPSSPDTLANTIDAANNGDAHEDEDAHTQGCSIGNPLHALTVNLLPTYRTCNPQFCYDKSLNPRRALSKDNRPAENYGYDNRNADLILHVNDVLVPPEVDDVTYRVAGVLGQGTFGQVVRCSQQTKSRTGGGDNAPHSLRVHKSSRDVAVKIIKNKPAYYNQALVEVRILTKLNAEESEMERRRIVRLLDNFTFRNHLCLVFEILSLNLYELIKQNKFRGLKMSFVKSFTAQILEGLQVLAQLNIVHCDLKPENILLENLTSPRIKIIDFGSACFDNQTVYTYIQSRFYRAPEVLLGLRYSGGIDMWSLGCIAVEIFMGLPIFPGVSEHNQISRIVELLGYPPDWMLETGKHVSKFFKLKSPAQAGTQPMDINRTTHDFPTTPDFPESNSQWILKSAREWAFENRLANPEITKRYFKERSLRDIVMFSTHREMKLEGRAGVDHEQEDRASFLDFVSGVLNVDMTKRWTPYQAMTHPFVCNKPFLQSHVPEPDPSTLKQHGVLASSSPVGILAANRNARRSSVQFHDGSVGSHPFALGATGAGAFSPRTPSQLSPPMRPLHPYPIAHTSNWGTRAAHEYGDMSPKGGFALDSRNHRPRHFARGRSQSIAQDTQMSLSGFGHSVHDLPAQAMHVGSCPSNSTNGLLYPAFMPGQRLPSSSGAPFPDASSMHYTHANHLSPSFNGLPLSEDRFDGGMQGGYAGGQPNAHQRTGSTLSNASNVQSAHSPTSSFQFDMDIAPSPSYGEGEQDDHFPSHTSQVGWGTPRHVRMYQRPRVQSEGFIDMHVRHAAHANNAAMFNSSNGFPQHQGMNNVSNPASYHGTQRRNSFHVLSMPQQQVQQTQGSPAMGPASWQGYPQLSPTNGGYNPLPGDWSHSPPQMMYGSMPVQSASLPNGVFPDHSANQQSSQHLANTHSKKPDAFQHLNVNTNPISQEEARTLDDRVRVAR